MKKVDYDHVHEEGNFSFWKERRFLSNMWVAGFALRPEHLMVFPDIDFDIGNYESSEHLYQGMKLKKSKFRKIVYSLNKPTDTKSLFQIIDKSAIRDDFDEIKDSVMALGLYLKFTQNPDLYKKLKEQDGLIQEINFWGDTYWGICDGVGKNKLGRMLTYLRDEGETDFFQAVKNGFFDD